MHFELVAILALSIKHFIVDFPLQAFPYQYKNKGTYGHPGGLLHSGLHAIGTFIVFMLLFWWIAGPAFARVFDQALHYSLLLAAADGVIHYHIDWAKMNINKKFNLGPTTSEWFWQTLGADQFLHTLTYIGLVFFMMSQHA